MSDNINPINQSSAVMAADSTQDRQEGYSQRRVAEDLLRESTKYTSDAKAKVEQAHQYLHAANALEKMAVAVRNRATSLRKNEISKDDDVSEIHQVAGAVLQMPVPKDATPDMLENIAKDLEAKVREFRDRADMLLRDANETAKMATKLHEQAQNLNKDDSNFSDLRLKSVAAHNEGLNMVFKKLGIFRLDAEYKEQVSYAQKKAQEEGEK